MSYYSKSKRRRIGGEGKVEESTKTVTIPIYVDQVLTSLGYDKISSDHKILLEHFVEEWIERISTSFVLKGKELFPYNVKHFF